MYALLRTLEILLSVTAYIGNPFLRYCVQWESRTKLHKMTGPVTAYNGILYIRYCVQWKSLYPLLRTMEFPTSVTAYNGIPYIRYRVQLHIPSTDPPTPDPGPPPAAGKISNPKSICIGVGAVVVVATRETRLCRQ